jgi:hypothetical protein
MTFAAVLRNKMNSKDFAALEKEYSIQSYPFVVLFKAFDEGKVELKSENFASLEEFILMHECPLLVIILFILIY